MEIREAAAVTEIAGAGVGAVMAQVAANLAAVMAGAADKIPRLVPQGKYLGRVEALAVVEAAVDAVFAAIGQMEAVAEVGAVDLPTLLQGPRRIRIRLGQRNVDALIVLVELDARAGGGRLLLAGNVDCQRDTCPSHGCITVGLRLGLASSSCNRRPRCRLRRGGRRCRTRKASDTNAGA